MCVCVWNSLFLSFFLSLSPSLLPSLPPYLFVYLLSVFSDLRFAFQIEATSKGPVLVKQGEELDWDDTLDDAGIDGYLTIPEASAAEAAFTVYYDYQPPIFDSSLLNSF